MRPIIAVVSSGREDLKSGPVSKHIELVRKSGGTPVIFLAGGDPRDVCEIADGILLTEGPDVHPYFYGADPSPFLRTADYDRDKFEIELFKRAFEMEIPVLGVGRGMHVMNVATNGTLYQDLTREIPKAIKHDWDPKLVDPSQRLHSVRMKTDSRLYEMVKDDLNVSSTNEVFIQVNSFHHQAVKRVGDGFRPVAFSIDGVVEAIEMGEGFYIGVQWRPEFLPEMRGIYRSFISAARKSQLRRIERESIEVKSEGNEV